MTGRPGWATWAASMTAVAGLITGCANATAPPPTSQRNAPLVATSSPASTASASGAVARPLAVTAGSRVWVSVAVATLWTSPRKVRAVDAPALSAPVHIRRWLGAMSLTQRRDLVGRVETQALYGDPLVVTGTSGTWLRVVAPLQPTSRDRRGYPGWVPARQVTTRRPLATTRIATVTRLTAWLHRRDGTSFEVSIGTRLPVAWLSATTVTVFTPTGTRVWARRSDVAVRTPTAAAVAATPSAVVTTARRFLGVLYLWGGRSGFAVDCSGLTSLVMAQSGHRLPRDADDQSWAGTGIARPTTGGDLTFYGPSSAPTHVAMYVGSGTLIHAPDASHRVTLVAATWRTPVRVRRVL